MVIGVSSDLKKNQIILAKYTFLIDLMPVLLDIVNRNNINIDINFKIKLAILPLSLGNEPRCSVCRMGQNVVLCKFRDDFWRPISN